MSPTADSAHAPTHVPSGAAAAALHALDGGELILLAIKPSGWFVLLLSWPVLLGAAVVAAGACVAQQWLLLALPVRLIYLCCTLVAMLRSAYACAQWAERLYVLTSRRVLTVQGTLRVRVSECTLKNIKKTALCASREESLLSVASLVFQDEQDRPVSPPWLCLSRPAEVREVVEQAIRRT